MPTAAAVAVVAAAMAAGKLLLMKRLQRRRLPARQLLRLLRWTIPAPVPAAGGAAAAGSALSSDTVAQAPTNWWHSQFDPVVTAAKLPNY